MNLVILLLTHVLEGFSLLLALLQYFEVEGRRFNLAERRTSFDSALGIVSVLKLVRIDPRAHVFVLESRIDELVSEVAHICLVIG